MLDEREFELVNIVGGALGSNQRDLSRQMNLSLGMTNMLVRRLVTKGYIRVQQLNKKKAEYLLTPKGFAEKMRKSVRYTVKTIHSIGLIRQSLLRLMLGLQAQGVRSFYYTGNSDLTVLVEMVMRDEVLKACRLERVESCCDRNPQGVFLLCRENEVANVPDGMLRIDLLEMLAGDVSVVESSLAMV